MRVSQMKKSIVDHFFMKRKSEKKYGLLYLGAIGIGKSTSVYEAAEEIASKLGRELLKVFVRWNPKKKTFTAGIDGMTIDEILGLEDKFFILTDYRLSTIEPSDLSGPLRSRKGIAFYDPLLWAVLHSANPGILFLDEITWIQRDDVFSVVPQLVLDKVAGLTAFHPDTLVVAAGNRPEDSASMCRLLHNALRCRFKVFKVTTTLDDWLRFMERKYGDEWDKRVYAFLLRFKDEGYILKTPEEPEGLENFPNPRSWTWLALDLYDGFDSLDDIIGLVGEEVGRKFHAFIKTEVDVEDLIKAPTMFRELSFDAKYMVPILLASWLGNSKNDVKKAFPLVDEMTNISMEFLVLTVLSMKRSKVERFISELLKHNQKYADSLLNIVEGVKAIRLFK